ncbi:uncharacterized protein LOC110430992 isoform X6 [Sorghum bicolor]|uniref:uncharacterized protein LOC110430992 isoform X6 n=1 Tax=Sorghum bicolor TaxID=4558 RepID=UPI000B425205|nr:uncharacterized protein LOC110430992 isoform X6 [Sorghum bicolor]|eukprot:XP_021305041.1 uncharacterized protein LOC110430992 isoform X6 [Sorghum bicolor]
MNKNKPSQFYKLTSTIISPFSSSRFREASRGGHAGAGSGDSGAGSGTRLPLRSRSRFPVVPICPSAAAPTTNNVVSHNDRLQCAMGLGWLLMLWALPLLNHQKALLLCPATSIDASHGRTEWQQRQYPSGFCCSALHCTCRVHSVSTAGMWLATLAVCEEPALQHLSKEGFRRLNTYS